MLLLAAVVMEMAGPTDSSILEMVLYFIKLLIVELPTKYSDPLLCTEAPSAAITASSLHGYDATIGTPVFGEFLPFLYSYFQVSPEMFDRVQVQALTGPLTDIQRLVSKPLLLCLGCVGRCPVGR